MKQFLEEKFRNFIKWLSIVINTIWTFIKQLFVSASVVTLILTTSFFFYKEIYIPNSAPINITLSLQLNKIGENNIKMREQKSLIAIEMKVSATNPSSRIVYLLPNVWGAYGEKIEAVSGDSFNDRANDELKSKSNVNFAERHSILKSATLVAVGNLFEDASLRPGETVIRTVIFHVPAKEYDLLEVSAYIPTAANPEQPIELEWKLDDDSIIEPILYSVDKQGERKPMKKDKFGVYVDETSEIQSAKTIVGLSLWH